MFENIIAEVEILVDDVNLNLDKVNIFINRAIALIKRYLNDDLLYESDIANLHKDVIVELVVRAYNSNKSKSSGVKSMSQGQRSVTYDTSLTNPFTLTSDLKAMLPLPKVRLL